MYQIKVSSARTFIHPLFPFLVIPLTKSFAFFLGIKLITSIKLLLALFSGTSAMFVFALARVLLKSTLFAALAAVFMLTSASYIFWSAVPETYVFGSATISATFFFSLAMNLRPRAHVFLHFFTMAFTITNWMAAVLASLSQFKISLALRVCALGLVIAIVASLWQAALLTGAEMFWYSGSVQGEVRFMRLPSFENIPLYGQRIVNFLFVSIVAPEPNLRGDTVRSSFTYSALGWSGLISWSAILGAGVVRAFSISTRLQFCLVVGVFALFQLGMHVIYGDEPFLYSMHFLPALVLIGCLSLTGRYRWFFAALMVFSIMTNTLNNYWRFQEAIDLMPL